MRNALTVREAADDDCPAPAAAACGGGGAAAAQVRTGCRRHPYLKVGAQAPSGSVRPIIGVLGGRAGLERA